MGSSFVHRTNGLAILALVTTAGLAEATQVSAIMEKEVTVAAPVAEVWNAWTTNEGLRFISSQSNVNLAIDGPYELFLDGEPDQRGRRGSESSRILAYLPNQMLAFTWTFPPDVPELRFADEVTQVVVIFDDISGKTTRVKLYVLGWQQGEAWDRGWDYFDRAWTIVLDRLVESFSAD